MLFSFFGTLVIDRVPISKVKREPKEERRYTIHNEIGVPETPSQAVEPKLNCIEPEGIEEQTDHHRPVR